MKGKTTTINMGKLGVTNELLDEIRNRMEKYERVKVKMLRAARGDKNRREIAREIAGKLNVRLVEIRGNTFTISGE